MQKIQTRMTRIPSGSLKFVSVSSAAMAAVASCLAFGPLTNVPNSFRHPEVANLSPQLIQPAPGSERVQFAVSLQPRDPVGLANFVEQVSDPKSPTYRHFITPDQVGAQFGPSQSDVNDTVAFLKANGFTVSNVSKNLMVILADGTAQQIETAFQTQVAYVPRPDGTEFYRTNLSPIQFPSELASKVVSIDGVDTSIRRVQRANTTTLNPTTYRQAYNSSAGYSKGFYGTGVNVAIINFDGYRLNNVPFWTKTYNLPIPTAGSGSNIHIIEVGTGATYGQGTPGAEGDLDMQAVLMSAPLANVFIYDDAVSDTSYPVSTYSKISSDNLADVVTESYGYGTGDGGTPTYVAAHNLRLSMSAQGITCMAATGDSGTEAFTNSPRYGYPDIDPEVLQVGGSEMTVDANGNRVSEAPWGLSNHWGGTGGFNPYDIPANGYTFNVAPSYQKSALPTQTSQYNYRLLPDVVSIAGGQDGLGSNSGTGWALQIFYYDPSAGGTTPTLTPIDGTSIASPAVAGSVGGLLSQLFAGVVPTSNRSNVRLGRLQNLIYSQGKNSSIFNDITTGSSIGTLPGTNVSAVPGVGWDFATGWGSINFGGLYSYLTNSTIRVTLTPTVSTLQGTYVRGNAASLATADGNDYVISSSNTAQVTLGQLATMEADYQISQSTMNSFSVSAQAIAQAGVTGQIFAYNYKTNNFDIIGNGAVGATLSGFSGSVGTNASNYVNSSGVVRIGIRGILPGHIKSTPFSFGVDYLNFNFG